MYGFTPLPNIQLSVYLNLKIVDLLLMELMELLELVRLIEHLEIIGLEHYEKIYRIVKLTLLRGQKNSFPRMG